MTISAEEFYNHISKDYDNFTRFDEGFEKVQQTVKSILKKYRMQSALDAACGSGSFSIALKQLGGDVVGTDISQAMLDKAVINAKFRCSKLKIQSAKNLMLYFV